MSVKAFKHKRIKREYKLQPKLKPGPKPKFKPEPKPKLKPGPKLKLKSKPLLEALTEALTSFYINDPLAPGVTLSSLREQGEITCYGSINRYIKTNEGMKRTTLYKAKEHSFELVLEQLAKFWIKDLTCLVESDEFKLLRNSL